MDPKFFYNVVVPTFVTKGTAFAGITTLGEDVEGKDDVNRLLEKKSKTGKIHQFAPLTGITGRSLFKVIVMDQVCEDCKRSGTAGTCKHKQGEIPWWQDVKRHDDLEQMMSKDHFEEFMRETKGFSVNQMVTPAFTNNILQEILQPDNDYSGTDHVKHIFVSVDPSAGGNRSKYAITSFIYPGKGEMVVSFFYISIATGSSSTTFCFLLLFFFVFFELADCLSA